ncbi:DUF2958 domain-containing protein [Mesorhizobium sp. Cs1299R1N1]|uniref:DUF2958 domain-containing protein n=1 Tax=unclassified Mesorhizobium TaxID=325217 RepID=UPI00301E27FB
MPTGERHDPLRPARAASCQGRNRGAEHVPLVRFFNRLGAGTWLVTELDDAGGTCSGWPICPELCS